MSYTYTVKTPESAHARLLPWSADLLTWLRLWLTDHPEADPFKDVELVELNVDTGGREVLTVELQERQARVAVVRIAGSNFEPDGYMDWPVAL